jgi:outer membrane murein-binding lipoprotein Lpp
LVDLKWPFAVFGITLVAHLTPWLQKEFHSSFRRSRIESHQQKVQELNAEITKLNMECQQLRQQALWKGFAGDLGKDSK